MTGPALGSAAPRSTVLFLLGVTTRCGTNFLHQLLRRHPDVAARYDLSEDYVLDLAGPLMRYATDLTHRWQCWWRLDAAQGPRFVASLGEGIEAYLAGDTTARYTLLKTPSAANAGLAPALFPRSPVICLVRDPRAVAVSARLTFGTARAETARRWAAGARQILAFLDGAPPDGSGAPRLLVRYEDLVADTEGELRRLFTALGLDPDAYDYAAARDAPVIGSSVWRGGAVEVHWTPVVKGPGFDPLRRAEQGGPWEAGLVAPIADLLAAFGYPAPAPVPARSRIGALLFDFDGTLWDCEPLIFQAYDEYFRRYGRRMPVELWHRLVGTANVSPWPHLEALTGRRVDAEAADRAVRRRRDALLAACRARPGIPGFLAAVDALGLRRGIVSNSERRWVRRYSHQCGIADGWELVECADGDPERAKPAPELYLAALQRLGLRADQVVAFEDSPTGIRAAKLAGIRCVAVYGPLTAHADLGEADARIDRFDVRDLPALLDRVGAPSALAGPR